MVPVDIRDPEDTVLTNRFALVYLPLPIGVADPIGRLFATKRHMDAIKRSPEALVTYQALAGLGVAPDRIARRVRSYFAGKVSVVLTNVPGPPRKLYFAGKLLDTIVFWVPQSGSIGVGISIFSYGGQVNIGLITDRGLAPDPDTIVVAFEEEFDDLLRLARVRKTQAGSATAQEETNDRRALRRRAQKHGIGMLRQLLSRPFRRIPFQ